MAKNTVLGRKIPKRVLGFKLSKGSRKDLRRILKRLEGGDARALVISSIGAALAHVAERIGQSENANDKRASKSAAAHRPN